MRQRHALKSRAETARLVRPPIRIAGDSTIANHIRLRYAVFQLLSRKTLISPPKKLTSCSQTLTRESRSFDFRRRRAVCRTAVTANVASTYRTAFRTNCYVGRCGMRRDTDAHCADRLRYILGTYRKELTSSWPESFNEAAYFRIVQTNTFNVMDCPLRVVSHVMAIRSCCIAHSNV